MTVFPLSFQAAEKLHDLPLGGRVQKGRRFIQNQGFTALGQNHGDEDLLSDASGEGVDIAFLQGGNPYGFHGVSDGLSVLLPHAAGEAQIGKAAVLYQGLHRNGRDDGADLGQEGNSFCPFISGKGRKRSVSPRKTWPPAISDIPFRHCSRVVFPQPLGPRRTEIPALREGDGQVFQNLSPSYTDSYIFKSYCSIHAATLLPPLPFQQQKQEERPSDEGHDNACPEARKGRQSGGRGGHRGVHREAPRRPEAGIRTPLSVPKRRRQMWGTIRPTKARSPV